MTGRAGVITVERHRLVMLAYRICGSWADAEDVVQQVAVEWLRVQAEIDNPAGWLTRVTVRRAIDVLRARQQVLTYPGPWLPEPLVDSARSAREDSGPHEMVERWDTLTTAFLVLAEALTPPQRAVVVLRSLDYSHSEIAEILGVSPNASRQHLVRGMQRLEEVEDPPARSRNPAALDGAVGNCAAQTSALLKAFLHAARDGDPDRLAELLHADVKAYQDGGGKTRAALRVLMGAQNVARFATGVAALHRAGGSAVFVNVNGAPGVILMLSNVCHVLSVEARQGRIYRLFDVCNPDKHTTLKQMEPVTMLGTS